AGAPRALRPSPCGRGSPPPARRRTARPRSSSGRAARAGRSARAPRRGPPSSSRAQGKKTVSGRAPRAGRSRSILRGARSRRIEMPIALRRPPVPVPARVRIRPARPADVPAVEALQQHAVREVAASALAGSAAEAWIRRLVAATRAPIADGTYLLATVDGVPAGCGGWSLRGPGAEPGCNEGPLDATTEPAWIHPVFVAPAFARRGVGAALLAAAERAAARAGYWRAALHATRASEALH